LTYENGVYVVVIDDIISSPQQILRFLEFSKKTHKPLVLVAQDFEAEALTTMVVNKLQNQLKVVAVKAPIVSGKEFLLDIAIFTGGTLISSDVGLRVD
jgi:chaperonin GroEL